MMPSKPPEEENHRNEQANAIREPPSQASHPIERTPMASKPEFAENQTKK